MLPNCRRPGRGAAAGLVSITHHMRPASYSDDGRAVEVATAGFRYHRSCGWFSRKIISPLPTCQLAPLLVKPASLRKRSVAHRRSCRAKVNIFDGCHGMRRLIGGMCRVAAIGAVVINGLRPCFKMMRPARRCMKLAGKAFGTTSQNAAAHQHAPLAVDRMLACLHITDYRKCSARRHCMATSSLA